MAQQDPETLDELLREGNNQFSTKMYCRLVNWIPGESAVLSAYSVLTLLAQLSLASEGASHDELLKVIGLPNDDVTKSVFPHLNDKLQAVNGIELKTANKIYISHNVELNPEYSALLKDIFNSEVKVVDFSQNIDTANEMNSWVENQTNNHITDLVSADDLNANTCSILLNAIYFLGNWVKPFNPDKTQEEDFHVSKDETIKVPMMHDSGYFKYTDSSDLNALLLELPYKGKESFFIVVLPKEVDGLTDLEERLNDGTAFEHATKDMKNAKVDLSLPRFKIETTIDLKAVLKEMDVNRIFDAQDANLDRLLLNKHQVYVSKAIQKAFIIVNEEGTEAGAANEVKMIMGAGPPSVPVSFIVDRPFYFVLKICNTIILSGRYIQDT